MNITFESIREGYSKSQVGSPTSVGAMEDTEEVCMIMLKGEKGVRAEYEERTGNTIKGNTILDLYEDIEFNNKNDMLCDIIYTIRELRRA